MKNIRQSKAFDRIVFVCIGMVIASVIYFSVNTTDAEKEILDTDGLVLTSLIINELNSRIIFKKIDALNYFINSKNANDFKVALEWLKRSTKAEMEAMELMIGKQRVIISNDTAKEAYNLISNTMDDFKSKSDMTIE